MTCKDVFASACMCSVSANSIASSKSCTAWSKFRTLPWVSNY
eukprot:UN07912